MGHPSALARFAALHGHERFALCCVTDVAVEANIWSALRWLRAPGTAIPYVIAYGTCRDRDREDLALVHGGPGPRPALSTSPTAHRSRGWSRWSQTCRRRGAIRAATARS